MNQPIISKSAYAERTIEKFRENFKAMMAVKPEGEYIYMFPVSIESTILSALEGQKREIMEEVKGIARQTEKYPVIFSEEPIKTDIYNKAYSAALSEILTKIKDL
mgnify:CR=1 FL=1